MEDTKVTERNRLTGKPNAPTKAPRDSVYKPLDEIAKEAEKINGAPADEFMLLIWKAIDPLIQHRISEVVSKLLK
jgi:hypothetical protein